MSTTRGRGLLQALLHPGEAPIRSGRVASIHVRHPAAEIDLLGWGAHWSLPFFAVSLAVGLGLKGRFGVEL